MAKKQTKQQTAQGVQSLSEQSPNPQAPPAANPYEILGQELVGIGLSPKDIESRINNITRSVDAGISIDQEIARPLVTGYVDGLIKAGDNLAGAYALIHGFGRWLYNGAHTDVRSRVIAVWGRQLAKELTERSEQKKYVDDRLDDLDRLKERGDSEAVNHIAEALFPVAPRISHKYASGTNRAGILRAIAERHSGNEEYCTLVASCLEEIGDTKALIDFAALHAGKGKDDGYNHWGNYFVGLIAKHADPARIVEIARDISTAYPHRAYELLSRDDLPEEGAKLRLGIAKQLMNVGIRREYGPSFLSQKAMVSDVVAIAREMVSESTGIGPSGADAGKKRNVLLHDLSTAYGYLSGARMSDGGMALRKDIAQRIMEFESKYGTKIEQQEKARWGDSWCKPDYTGFVIKTFTDHPIEDTGVWKELGKRQLAASKPSSAMYCFWKAGIRPGKSSEQQPVELKEIGMLALKLAAEGKKEELGHRDSNLDLEIEWTIDQLKHAVAIDYFKRGGSVAIVQRYIHYAPIGVIRKLAKGLAESDPSDSYKRLISIPSCQLNRQDKQLLNRVRMALVKEAVEHQREYPPYDFDRNPQNRDMDGIRMYFNANLEPRPNISYGVAIKYQQESWLQIARDKLLAGKLADAYTIFQRHSDEEGLKAIRQLIAPGADPRIVEALI